jgi:hypothetical protein
MKKMMILSALSMVISMQAHATCGGAALVAAENTYGNDPTRTRVKEVTPDTFEVTVGIGNTEDGAHTYAVKFEGGSCDPKTASVCDKTIPEDNDPSVCHE